MSPSRLQLLADRGSLLLIHGDLDSAELVYKTGIVIVAMSLGPRAPAAAGFYGGLASVQLARGNAFEAVELFNKELMLLEACPGNVALHLGTCLYRMAAAHLAMGHLDAAEALLQRGLVEPKLRIDVKGLLRNGLSMCALQRHNGPLALAHALCAVQWCVVPLDRAAALHNLGSVYIAMNRLRAAARAFEYVLAIEQGLYRGDAPMSLQTLISLAHCYTALGKHDKARVTLGRAAHVGKRFPQHDQRLVAEAERLLTTGAHTPLPCTPPC